MQPDQAAQFIAVKDIGRIVAAVFADPDKFVGQTVPVAGDEVTGRQLATALSRASGRPIVYRRFPELVFAESEMLRGAAALVDDGRLAGDADIQALRRLVPGLYDLDAWLGGPGRPLLEKALTADPAGVALR